MNRSVSMMERLAFNYSRKSTPLQVLDRILNTPKVKVVNTDVELFSFKIKEIESLVTNKLTTKYKEKFESVTTHLRQLRQSFEVCFFCMAVFDFFSNSERNISVVPWSSFYVFKDILCTKQPFSDIFFQNRCSRPATLLKRDSNTGVFL